jgi:hypothetical protein
MVGTSIKPVRFRGRWRYGGTPGLVTVRSGKTPGRIARQLYFFMGLLRKAFATIAVPRLSFTPWPRRRCYCGPIADRMRQQLGVLDHLGEVADDRLRRPGLFCGRSAQVVASRFSGR